MQPVPPPRNLADPLRLVNPYLDDEERKRKKVVADLRAKVEQLKGEVIGLEATLAQQKHMHQVVVDKLEEKMAVLVEEKSRVKLLLREAYVKSIAL